VRIDQAVARLRRRTRSGEADRGAAERRLRAAEARWDAFTGQHPHGVFELDPTGRFVSANQAWEDLTGHPAHRLEGRRLLDLLRPADRAALGEVLARLATGVHQEFEVSVRRLHGGVVDLSVVGLAVVVDGEVVVMHGVARSVTERNRVLRDLQRATRDVEKAEDARALFTAHLSHELRTPLTSIASAVELLDDTDLDPLQRELAGTVARGARRLRGLVDNLVDVARLGAGSGDLHVVEIHLCSLVEEIVAIARPAALERGLELTGHVDAEVPDYVHGDPVRITQVLTHLIGNAVKFTPQGRVRVVVSRRSVGDGRADLLLEVCDTGIGMTAEQRGRLFRPFSQADSSIARHFGGIGLGLAISRHLVELMDGSIWVESEHGVGSTFSFRIPLPDALPDDLPDAPPDPADEVPSATRADPTY
jgi:PAS domain S-box-containing protein